MSFYKNKNVLITGANSGLGKYLTQKFLKEGHNVIEHKGTAHFDLRNLNEISDLIEFAIKKKVNVLVNNAAIVCPSISFSTYTIEQINDMIDVNLRAPLLLIFGILPQLTDIININSMVGLEIKKNRTLYSATKWGLRGFSNSLKKELNYVNTLDVYPTNIKTNPEKQNAMDVDSVVEKIYHSFLARESELILDGRLK